MVTWGRAFRAAFVEVVFGFLWWLLGFFVFLVGLGFLLGPFFPIPLRLLQVPADTSCALGIVLIAVGFFLMALGFVAARLKVQSELTAEEVWRSQFEWADPAMPAPRNPPPPPP